MFRLIFISLLVVAVLGRDSISRDNVEWEKRIVGGEVASAGQFPFMASMRTTGNTHLCGATIIGMRWVVTAAHCATVRAPDNTIIVAGTISRTDEGDSYNINWITVHPNFRLTTLENDIALIQTKQNIVFGDLVQPIQMMRTVLGGGQNVTVMGWGQTSNPGVLARNLRFVQQESLTNEQCREQTLITLRSRVVDSSLCAAGGLGVGFCIGDSGGPLIFDDMFVGVISWGVPCALNRPDVYVRISSFASWITSVTGVL